MVNLQQLRSWLDSPEVVDDETLRQVSLLNQVFRWGVLFLAVTLMLYPFLYTARNARQYFFISLVLLVTFFVAKLMLNQRWISAAGHLIATIFWLTFIWAAFLSPDGMAGTPFLAAVTITPIVAGFINGTRASILVTLLNWLVGGYIAWLDLTDPTRNIVYYEEPVFRYLVLMIMVSVFPFIVHVWHRNLQQAVGHVRLSEQALAETAAYRLQNEQLEEAVANRTKALEDSLAREQHLAKKLAQALETEMQLSEMQSRIITVVSHEFRTPLSVINSSSDLIQLYYERLPEARRDAAHQRIRESIFYLNDLLKDVTMVDKAQRAMIRPSYQTYPFSELCHQLTSRLLDQSPDPGRLQFHFAAGVELSLQMDLALLEQILVNLISNSLKYSEKGSQVQIRFWLDGRSFCVEVQDAGVGVPRHEQPQVFELFYRASNVDERRGLGLGLFIVQAICNLLQGSVHLHSEGEGQGASFTVQLPLAPVLDSLGEEQGGPVFGNR